MINDIYVLFTRIPIKKDNNGRIFCDPLWGKDLKLHLQYIKNFAICCPVEEDDDTKELMDITDCDIKCFFELKTDSGLKSVLQNVFPNFWVAMKACKYAEIIHSGGAGWTFPLSFYVLFFRLFFPFKWIVLIESSFWMIGENENATIRKKIAHYVHKILLSRCVKVADARIFTQSFYREYFLKEDTERTLINPATWVDDENFVTSQDVEKRFNNKTDKVLRIVFPSRLIQDKGVFVVFDVIERLKKRNIVLHFLIIGVGELEKECQLFASKDHGNIKVEYKQNVDYDKSFFEILAEHDFVLVPTIKQEQPRIIFDAFSQGVPVIGSDTSGVQDITNSNNALTFKTGDSSSLEQVISYIVENPNISLEMGLAGLDYVHGKTHLQMHKDREIFINSVLYPET